MNENENQLEAKYIGEININGVQIKCAVLSNEKRVFFQREVVGALTGNKKGGLGRYLNAKNLDQYLPEKYKIDNLDEAVIKFMSNGKEAHGYEAEDLIDICQMYIQARNDGMLHDSQKHLAIQADVIVNAFAKTGVIAVIDEATGYQKYRNKDALRVLVEAYVIQEAKKWVKEFPDEFFIELDRIYNNPTTKPQSRPKYYGKFINKYIYQPIENGIILDELRNLNPVDRNGARRNRFHQFLTEELGIKTLRNRIAKVTALLQISANKRRFESNYQRMESKQNSLFDIDEYEVYS
jgi:hypothetical protein